MKPSDKGYCNTCHGTGENLTKTALERETGTLKPGEYAKCETCKGTGLVPKETK